MESFTGLKRSFKRRALPPAPFDTTPSPVRKSIAQLPCAPVAKKHPEGKT